MAKHKEVDKDKRRIERAAALFHFFVKSEADIEYDLNHAGNKLIRKLKVILDDALNKLESEYHRKMFKKLSNILLWVVYKDTAYKHPVEWILKKILDEAESILPLFDPLPPEVWYANQHVRAKKITAEMRESGLINEKEMAGTESLFSDDAQLDRVRRFMVESDGK